VHNPQMLSQLNFETSVTVTLEEVISHNVLATPTSNHSLLYNL
jgi:hypothetical protein